MRKVLSWVLVLAMVLTSFSMAFAAEFSDTTGAACDEAVNVLSELGVVNGYEDGTYQPEKVVTRAEASKLIVAALGLTTYATGSKASFTDLSGYDWASGFIGYSESLGVLKGDGNGKFRPGDTVTYNEMATIILRALGYTDESLAGTWPANYVSKAKTLGVMADITGGGGAVGANRGDVAIMLYNVLDDQIGYVNTDNEWVTDFTKDAKKSDTMLERLGAKSYNNDAAFIVKYTDAADAATNLMPYIGAKITAYEDKDGDIIAVNEVKSTFLTGKFSSASKFKVGDVEYSFAADAFNASNAAIQFVNADDVGSYASLAALFAAYGKNGNTAAKEITLSVDYSGKTIKSVFAALEWDPTEVALFADDGQDEINDDHELLTVKFPEDDNKEIDTAMFALNGVASLDAIAEDNVVYVYECDEKIVRVDVGTETVSGEVTIKDGKKYTVNGTKYEEASKLDSTSELAGTKDTVKFFLDYSGKIYSIEVGEGGASDYAVVLEAANGSKGLNGDDPCIKLLLADGTVATYDADYKEIKDATVITLGAVATKIEWQSGIASGKLVKYGLDSDGVIDDMEIVATTTGYSKVNASGYYASKKIATNAVIFTFDGNGGDWTGTAPTFTTDKDDYGITTRDKVLDIDAVGGYYATKDGLIVALILDSAASSSDEVYGVVTGRAENNSDAGYQVTVLIDGEEVTKNAKSADYDTANTKNALYEITYDANDNIKLAAFTATETYNISGASISVKNNVYTVSGAGVYTVDDDILVYRQNADDKWVKGTTSYLKNADYNVVALYDTEAVADRDGVYDIALVYNK